MRETVTQQVTPKIPSMQIRIAGDISATERHIAARAVIQEISNTLKQARDRGVKVRIAFNVTFEIANQGSFLVPFDFEIVDRITSRAMMAENMDMALNSGVLRPATCASLLSMVNTMGDHVLF